MSVITLPPEKASNKSNFCKRRNPNAKKNPNIHKTFCCIFYRIIVFMRFSLLKPVHRLLLAFKFSGILIVKSTSIKLVLSFKCQNYVGSHSFMYQSFEFVTLGLNLTATHFGFNSSSLISCTISKM